MGLLWILKLDIDFGIAVRVETFKSSFWLLSIVASLQLDSGEQAWIKVRDWNSIEGGK